MTKRILPSLYAATLLVPNIYASENKILQMEERAMNASLESAITNTPTLCPDFDQKKALQIVLPNGQIQIIGKTNVVISMNQQSSPQYSHISFNMGLLNPQTNIQQNLSPEVPAPFINRQNYLTNSQDSIKPGLHHEFMDNLENRLVFNQNVVVSLNSPDMIQSHFLTTHEFNNYITDKAKTRLRKSFEESAMMTIIDPLQERVELSDPYLWIENKIDDAAETLERVFGKFGRGVGKVMYSVSTATAEGLDPREEAKMIQTPLSTSEGLYYDQPKMENQDSIHVEASAFHYGISFNTAPYFKLLRTKPEGGLKFGRNIQAGIDIRKTVNIRYAQETLIGLLSIGYKFDKFESKEGFLGVGIAKDNVPIPLPFLGFLNWRGRVIGDFGYSFADKNDNGGYQGQIRWERKF